MTDLPMMRTHKALCRTISAAAILAALGALALAAAAPALLEALRSALPGDAAASERLAPDRLVAAAPRLRVAAVGAGIVAAAIAACPGLLLAVLSAIIADLRRLPRAARREWRVAHRRPAHAAILAAACAVFLLFAAGRLDQPIRCDEARTFLNFGARPVAVALVSYASTNNHMLFSVLMRGAISLFGDAAWVIRLPALLAGLAIVPLLYVAGRAHLGHAPALVAACAVAPLLYITDAAANARGYTLMTACLLAAIAILPRLLAPRSRAWGLLYILIVLGMWTVPVFAFGLAACALWLALASSLRGSAALRRTAGRLALFGGAAVVSVLALYTPALILSGPIAAENLGVVGAGRATSPLSRAPDTAAAAVMRLVEVGESWAFGIVPPLSALVLAALIWHLARTGALARRRAPLLWCILIAHLGLTLVVGVPLPPWSHFYLAPIAILGAAAGAADLLRLTCRHTALTPALAALVLIAATVMTIPHARRVDVPWLLGYPPAAEAIARLEPHLRTGARLHAAPVAAQPLAYHLHAVGLNPHPDPDDRPDTAFLLLLGEHANTRHLLRHLHLSGYRWTGEFIHVGPDTIAAFRLRPIGAADPQPPPAIPPSDPAGDSPAASVPSISP